MRRCRRKLKLYYRDHYSGYKRVWFNDWRGDQFQVIDNKSFTFLKNVCDRFEIAMEMADEE